MQVDETISLSKPKYIAQKKILVTETCGESCVSEIVKDSFSCQLF